MAENMPDGERTPAFRSSQARERILRIVADALT
jgi:hypothetical protein